VRLTRFSGVDATHYPLSLAAHAGERLQLRLSYRPDLFERASVEALAARLVRLLEAAVADPRRAIGKLEILAPAERRTILEAWNATARAVPAATLPALFAAQAAATPEAVAAVCAGHCLSYGELDARANRLAQHLRALGVGPEVVVGLCLERSLEMLIGLIAILKAGGAYLPLDPGYPRERLAFMLADAGAPVLLTQQALRAALPAHGAHVVCLDAEAEAIARHPATAPATALAPQHPAYVIYTSGSTGTPKGVVVTHAGIPTLAGVQVDRFAITSQARVLQFASPSFDAALSEIVTALTSGAALILVGTASATARRWRG
jgi:non-ribosomal peptide synthetase component F